MLRFAPFDFRPAPLRFPLCSRSAHMLELDAGKQIDVIYTDFEKAFDKVSHHALISKLLAWT